MGKIKDYSGTKVGSLTILEATKERCSSGVVYNAACKCGNKRTIPSGTIRRAIREGYKPSCNKCENSEIIITGNPEEAALRFLYKQYKHSAKMRGYSFELSLDDFKSITKEDCVYCGVEPKQVCKTYNKGVNGEYTYNGLDRVDSNRGYELNNIKPCCGTCNTMKSNLTYEEFISHIKKVFSKAYPCFMEDWNDPKMDAYDEHFGYNPKLNG